MLQPGKKYKLDSRGFEDWHIKNGYDRFNCFHEFTIKEFTEGITIISFRESTDNLRIGKCCFGYFYKNEYDCTTGYFHEESLKFFKEVKSLETEEFEI